MDKKRLSESKYQLLLKEAIKNLDRAYAPYSHYQVGAALLDAEGRIWSGVNIENASYSITLCAERTALFKAVSEGARSFQALAVVGRRAGDQHISSLPAAPCGACRQALNEFCSPHMPILLPYFEKGEIMVSLYELGDLLPLSFGPDNLESQGGRE